MARKYKKNRIRGTRAAHYKETVVGGLVIPRKPEVGGLEAYIKEFIHRNYDILANLYSNEIKALDRAINKAAKANNMTEYRDATEAKRRYLEKNYSVDSYVRNIVLRKGTRLTKKRLVSVVQARLAPMSYRQRVNIINRIKANSDFYQDLLLRIQPDEQDINIQRIQYEGNSVFIYRAVNGKVLKFEFSDFSEADILWIDNGGS